MQIARKAHDLLKASPTYNLMRWIVAIFHWMSEVVALSVEIFTRFNFGERYISRTNCLFAILTVGAALRLNHGLSISAYNNTLASRIFTERLQFVAICFAIYHLYVVYKKNKRGVVWHSFYSGDSYLKFTGLPERTIKRWIEPVVLFIISAICGHFQLDFLQGWLWLGSVSIWINESLQDYKERSELLSERDAWIEAMYRQQARRGKVTQNRGYSQSKATLALAQQIEDLPDPFEGLSEDIRKVMDEVA